MTWFSLPLSMDCPNKSWEPCLRRSWMHSLNPGPAHPCPLLLLLHIPNPKAWAAKSPSFWPNSALRSPGSLFRGQHTPCGALWALSLANLGGNSQVLVQICQAVGSARALSDFALIPVLGTEGLLLAKRCMWCLEMRAADGTEYLMTGPAPLYG